jgi:3',5'-cyclic-AMP phosphodiesterase
MEGEMRFSRRSVLAGGGLGAVVATGADAAGADRGRVRVARIAHLTDIHIQPEQSAAEGLRHCLEQVYALPDRPDVIFNGGDVIMDALGADYERTHRQWNLLLRVLRDFGEIPLHHCLGNHDVWGWDRQKSGCRGDESLYGKQWAQDLLRLERPYYDFPLGNWRVIVLDSTHVRPDAVYTARLEDAQREWLAATLAEVPEPTPVLVLSHIPILCGCAFLDGDNEKSGDWRVPGAWMHIDARAIKDLFGRHPNVRLCLSGHIHLQDRLDYNGLTYLCNGAVSGAWWRGNYQETPPGFALVDLYSDGTFDHQYHPTGWTPT